MIKILPPTRTARQLAAWVNAHPVVDGGRRRVRAKVERSHSSTDRQIGRLRWPGKGRSGVRLTLYAYDSNNDQTGGLPVEIYQHDTSETYRTHDEARQWISTHLTLKRRRT